MTNIIFYFSGTGNSLQIAREIAEKLEDTQVISIARAIKMEIQYPIEILGLVFPVYFGALPPLVESFVEKLDPTHINYIFSVATNNGYYGATLYIVNKILKKKGKMLNAGFSIKMPGNYLPMYAPLSKDKQEQRFNNAREEIKKIIRVIEERQGNGISGMGRFLQFMQKRNNRKLPLRDVRFWVDDKCNSCGICEKICPVQNIKMEENKPKWLHKCQQCLACLHWCPQESIQVGNKTNNRERYQNPYVKLSDMMF